MFRTSKRPYLGAAINLSFFLIFLCTGINIGLIAWHLFSHTILWKLKITVTALHQHYSFQNAYQQPMPPPHFDDPPQPHSANIISSTNVLAHGDVNILIGIMTSQKSLKDRVHSIIGTWGQSCLAKNEGVRPSSQNYYSSYVNRNARDVQITFMGERDLAPHKEFCYEDNLNKDQHMNRECKLTVKPECFVALPEVHDVIEYPPMVKAFAMFRHMYDKHILLNSSTPRINWFIRMDDDVYPRIDLLKRFLNTLDTNKLHYIGQTGIGRAQDEDTKQLFSKANGLNHYQGSVKQEAENFCMGGTGIIMSRKVLEKIGPFIQRCLQEIISPHDDVEIGRCVFRYANTQCSWSYEGTNIFFNNYADRSGLSTPNKPNAIIVHPLKSPVTMYTMHQNVLISRMRRLRRVINQRLRVKQLIALNERKPRHIIKLSDVPVYSTVSKEGKILQTSRLRNPHIFLPYFWRYYIANVTLRAFQTLKSSLSLPTKFNFRALNVPTQIYMEWMPSTLPLASIYSSANGKMLAPRFQSIKCFVGEHVYDKNFRKSVNFHEVNNLFEHDNLLFTEAGYANKVLLTETEPIINFIVPFSNRYHTMTRFLNLYEELCLQNRIQYLTTLSIIAFIGQKTAGSNKSEETHSALVNQVDLINERYKNVNRYDSNNHINNISDKNIHIQLIQGQFSRALALEYGTSLFNESDLLLFLDVDMVFNEHFLRRTRMFTKRGKSVYFPIVFSQYKTTRSTVAIPPTVNFEGEGFWNIYGFGMVTIYKSDFTQSGGFDMDIRGWGKEDVDLYTKIIAKTPLTIYRTAEPGLIHVYHKRHCPSLLENSQYKMCIDSLASYEANKNELANQVLNHT